jgi:dihydrofolate reductase
VRDLVYYIATSVDGRIAAADGDFSVFPQHPDTLRAVFDLYPETCPTHLRAPLQITASAQRFDTVVMGYRTHEPALAAGLTSAYPHLRQFVATHRRLPADPTVETMSGDVAAQVARLKAEPGRDIWLCGGADLAGQLLDVIDEVQVKVNPVILGDGIPLFGTGGDYPQALELADSLTLPGGVVLLTYRKA